MPETQVPEPISKPPRDGRKLVAVVYADMVGYSRLIGLDDAGTLQRPCTLRREVIDPAIKEHGGRIVQTGGDLLLIAFDSIDGAVCCAMKVQQQVPIHDRDQPPDRAIRFRVGINLGDAIADGTDLHGDAVNVAARLQAECPPAGICVSRSVRDHVHGRLDLAFQELGPLNLKNIARPVEAFVVKYDEATADPKPIEEPTAPSLPDKPSIAVLPFANLSSEIEQEYFADGVADEIIARLSRCRWLFVIARNSSFSYRGRSVDVKQVGWELGVRYVVEGSVRRDVDRVRVGAQLVDAMNGHHLWAERYDRGLEHVFAVQDEIADAVVTAIRPTVGDAEMRRALLRPRHSLGAWDLYQQGMWHMSKLTPAENETARILFDRATKIDPMFAAAYVGLSRTYQWAGAVFLTMPMKEAMRSAEEHARAAVQLDTGDADAYGVLAMAFLHQGNMGSALTMAQQALVINPDSVMGHRAMSAVLIYTGRTAEGRESVASFTRLSPHDASIASTQYLIAMSYYVDGDYLQCIKAARRLLSARPDFTPSYIWLAAALGQLDRAEEAHAVIAQATSVSSQDYDARARMRVPWLRPEDHEHMLDGLRKAGWQG